MTDESDPDGRATGAADAAALAERVRAGDLRLYELEEHASPETAAAARRHLLTAETATDLETVGAAAVDASEAESNVENFIGTAQVPMGVAGPVPVDGGAADGEYYLPMATTEGALVASVNRGLSAIRDAGGATARVTDSGMTRAPVFQVTDVAVAEVVVDWVEEHLASLREAAESTTSHGELLAVDPYVVGDNVFLRFVYDTKDAMGMNMATIATREAADVVEAETPAELVALSGNLCSDKKPAAINAVEGRGRSVTADVLLPRQLVEETLKTSPEAMAEGNTRKNLVGSAKAASLGFNAHAANPVAAVFLATGQDAAQVVEGANAITTMEARDDGLYASVSIASLEVGTVGGGTKLPTQTEGLEILGLAAGHERGRARRSHRGRCPGRRALACRRLHGPAPGQRPRGTRSVRWRIGEQVTVRRPGEGLASERRLLSVTEPTHVTTFGPPPARAFPPSASSVTGARRRAPAGATNACRTPKHSSPTSGIDYSVS